MNDMIMTNVTSSNIDSIGYSPIDKRLRVRFHNGRSYDYEDVPQNVAQAFQDADSHGKFFNANIRDSYSYSEV